MVGLLFKVGQEKIEPAKVKEILESKSRKKNGVTAPAEGLYLVNVVYSNLDEFLEKDDTKFQMHKSGTDIAYTFHAHDIYFKKPISFFSS